MPLARSITENRGRTASTVSADASPADNLNSSYARFKASNNIISGTIDEVSSIARDEHTPSVTEHNVRRALMRENSKLQILTAYLFEY